MTAVFVTCLSLTATLAALGVHELQARLERWATSGTPKTKACRTISLSCGTALLGRRRQRRRCGANVSFRVIRAGFTGTRRVLVSAVPSADIGGPASCLGVRGS